MVELFLGTFGSPKKSCRRWACGEHCKPTNFYFRVYICQIRSFIIRRFDIEWYKSRPTLQIFSQLLINYTSNSFCSLLFQEVRYSFSFLSAPTCLTNLSLTILVLKIKMAPASKTTSSRRKQRKAHFGASSVERARRMSSSLSKELQQKYNVSLNGTKVVHTFIMPWFFLHRYF